MGLNDYWSLTSFRRFQKRQFVVKLFSVLVERFIPVKFYLTVENKSNSAVLAGEKLSMGSFHEPLSYYTLINCFVMRCRFF